MQAGPSPRDVSRAIGDVIQSCFQPALNLPLPPTITLIERVGELSWNRSDRYTVRSKTDDISTQMLDGALTSSADVMRFVFGCHHMDPSMASLLFKVIAIRATSGGLGPDAQGMLFRLEAMSEIPSPGSCSGSSRRFVYWTGEMNITLTVNTDWRIQLRDGLPNGVDSIDAASRSLRQRRRHSKSDVLPVTDRNIIRYYDVDTITADANHYYLVERSSNPCFDAFFYEVKATKVVIWVLVLTVKRVAGDANTDSMTIERLRMRAREAWPRRCVEVKYVLVVPIAEPVLSVFPVRRIVWVVEWKMNRELCGGRVGGDVFVQFLNIWKFSIGDVFRSDGSDRLDDGPRLTVEDAM